mmetsp:Transcript_58408/g.153808  ORF Transcript_58408/g.153808 Transcript_58408/m.153808 type:complete len:239 (-) Transcript_58408:74-790(-)
MAAAAADQVIDVFRRHDAKGDGLIRRDELVQLLKMLESSSWVESSADKLLEDMGVGAEQHVRYEDFVRRVMSAGSPGLPAEAAEASLVCQAALDGKAGYRSAGAEKMRKPGYVLIDGALCGLWTVGGTSSFQMKPLAEEPNLHPATPFHYAAFAGRTAVLKYLLEECHFDREDEMGCGFSPLTVFKSHRLNPDGSLVEDENGAEELMEEEAPLCHNAMAKSLERGFSRKFGAGAVGTA